MRALDVGWPVRGYVASVDISYLFASVVAVQVGDVLTTIVGVYCLGLGELNPLMEMVLSRAGILGLLATKFCWFGIAIAGSLLVGDSRRVLKYCFLSYLLVGGPAVASNVALIGFFLI